jgi:hypothetical protein
LRSDPGQLLGEHRKKSALAARASLATAAAPATIAAAATVALLDLAIIGTIIDVSAVTTLGPGTAGASGAAFAAVATNRGDADIGHEARDVEHDDSSGVSVVASVAGRPLSTRITRKSIAGKRTATEELKVTDVAVLACRTARSGRSISHGHPHFESIGSDDRHSIRPDYVVTMQSPENPISHDSLLPLLGDSCRYRFNFPQPR